MHSKCELPNFDDHDWKQFDFTRWHLDGLTLDAAAAAFASLADRLSKSGEWQQHVQASLPQLQTHVLESYRERSLEIMEERAIAEKEFDRRITTAQETAKDFRKSSEAAAAPRVIEQSPNAYQLAVKVNSKDRLGLPGLVVQMMHPKEERTVLAQALTDVNGNAVLALPVDVVKEFDKQETSFEILTPDGKVLERLTGAAFLRIGQTETKVATVADTTTIAGQKEIGLRAQSEREFEMRRLDVRVDTLRSEKEKRLKEFDHKLHCNQEIIAEIERVKPSPAHEAAASDKPEADETESTEPGTSKRTKRSSSKQSRKK